MDTLSLATKMKEDIENFVAPIIARLVKMLDPYIEEKVKVESTPQEFDKIVIENCVSSVPILNTVKCLECNGAGKIVMKPQLYERLAILWPCISCKGTGFFIK